MAPMPKDKALRQAVFESITESTYPEDENVISADLSSSALQGLSESLERARADVKVSITVATDGIYNLTSHLV